MGYKENCTTNQHTKNIYQMLVNICLVIINNENPAIQPLIYKPS